MSRKKSGLLSLLLARRSCLLAKQYGGSVDFATPKTTQMQADALVKRIEEIGEKLSSNAHMEVTSRRHA
jgi:hypothetical protein